MKERQLRSTIAMQADAVAKFIYLRVDRRA